MFRPRPLREISIKCKFSKFLHVIGECVRILRDIYLFGELPSLFLNFSKFFFYDFISHSAVLTFCHVSCVRYSFKFSWNFRHSSKYYKIFSHFSSFKIFFWIFRFLEVYSLQAQSSSRHCKTQSVCYSGYNIISSLLSSSSSSWLSILLFRQLQNFDFTLCHILLRRNSTYRIWRFSNLNYRR